MKLLLDTHVFLWWLLNDPRLSRVAAEGIKDLSNQLFLSSMSGAEIAIKAAIGKFKLPASVEEFVEAGMRQGLVNELPMSLRHTYRLSHLPPLHGDPFDRMLIAVAMKEELTLLTDDHIIAKYPVKTLW